MIKLSANCTLPRKDEPFTAGLLTMRGEAAPITRYTILYTICCNYLTQRFHQETCFIRFRTYLTPVDIEATDEN